jgi:hypothetical protein
MYTQAGASVCAGGRVSTAACCQLVEHPSVYVQRISRNTHRPYDEQMNAPLCVLGLSGCRSVSVQIGSCSGDLRRDIQSSCASCSRVLWYVKGGLHVSVVAEVSEWCACALLGHCPVMHIECSGHVQHRCRYMCVLPYVVVQILC